MMTLHVFFTLLIFAPIWFVVDPILQRIGAWANIVCLYGTIFFSSMIVTFFAQGGQPP